MREFEVEVGDIYVGQSGVSPKGEFRGIIIILSDSKFSLSWDSGAHWDMCDFSISEKKYILSGIFWKKV